MLLSTLWPAAEAFAQLPNEIVLTVHATITAPMPPELSKFGRHSLIQQRVKTLGDRLGYEGRTEVATDEIVRARTGRLDVVWIHPDPKRSIAVEIDSAWRQRSIQKLARMSASHLCLWIYYGARPVVTDGADQDLCGVNILQVDPEALEIPQRRTSSVRAPNLRHPGRAQCRP